MNRDVTKINQQTRDANTEATIIKDFFESINKDLGKAQNKLGGRPSVSQTFFGIVLRAVGKKPKQTSTQHMMAAANTLARLISYLHQQNYRKNLSVLTEINDRLQSLAPLVARTQDTQQTTLSDTITRIRLELQDCESHIKEELFMLAA